MISKHRGDTFEFCFTVPEGVIIEARSIVRVGVRSTEEGAEYSLFQEISVDSDTNEIYVVFPAEETAKLTPSDELELYDAAYILEVEVTSSTGIVTTSFQEEIEIVRDYVYE